MFFGIVLNIWAERPVYHDYGEHEYVEGQGWIERTKCGRVIGTYKPSLPMKHLVKFARPCKGCFAP